jgi:hypothetical protein
VPEVSQHRFHASGTFPKRKPEGLVKKGTDDVCAVHEH